MCTHEPCKMGLADLALGGQGAGAGHWAPGGGAGKKRIGVPGHGFMRVSASVFLSSCLTRPGFFQGGPGPPTPIPSFPGTLPSFPSRAGPGTVFPIVSLGLPCRVGRGSWHLLLVTYKWWLVEEAPEGGSREQACLENGPGQAPRCPHPASGVVASRASPRQCGLCLHFLCLLGITCSA